MGHYGRIESLADLPPDHELEAQIRAAMAIVDLGKRPARTKAPRPEAEVPPALSAALDADPAARAIFHDPFAPSHRREYCEWIADAKRGATREQRVAQAIAWIGDGKQRNWKYQR